MNTRKSSAEMRVAFTHAFTVSYRVHIIHYRKHTNVSSVGMCLNVHVSFICFKTVRWQSKFFTESSTFHLHFQWLNDVVQVQRFIWMCVALLLRAEFHKITNLQISKIVVFIFCVFVVNGFPIPVRNATLSKITKKDATYYYTTHDSPFLIFDKTILAVFC